MALKTPRPSQFTEVQILSHLITPSNVTARLSVTFPHALHFWHAHFARTASPCRLAGYLAVALGCLALTGAAQPTSFCFQPPGTLWCCLAFQPSRPSSVACSLARRPRSASGTQPSRYAVSQPNPSLVTSSATAFGVRPPRPDEFLLTLGTTLLAVFSLPPNGCVPS